MPAFSKVAPSDSTRATPPPPPGRSQRSSRKRPPAVEPGEERGRVVVQALHQRRDLAANGGSAHRDRSRRAPLLHRVDEGLRVAPPGRREGCRGRDWRCGPGRRTPPASRACGARIVAGGAYSQQGSRLPCSADRPVAPAGGARRPRRSASRSPITSAPVAAAISSSAHPAPGAKAITGTPGPARDPHRLRQVGQRELAEVARPEGARPGVEQLHRLGAGPHLRHEERAHRPRQPRRAARAPARAPAPAAASRG